MTGNDFAVKEIVLCLDEVARAGMFPKEQMDAWRAGIASIVPETTYSCQPKPGSKTARNWCVFGAANEQARAWAGLGGDTNYVERAATVSADNKVIRVSFDGWTCRYTTSGEFVDTGLVYANRNGHYRRFEARGKKRLNVRMSIMQSLAR